jgi:3'(2'), 5'-bisphosphate nucleotidase
VKVRADLIFDNKMLASSRLRGRAGGREPTGAAPFAAEIAAAGLAARRGGAAAIAHYGTAAAAAKEDRSPVTAADLAANAAVLEALGHVFPDDAVLSEESRDSVSRLALTRLWVVDPLDGTKEFLARNGEFAVMVGLAVDGEAVVGAVYLPVPDVLYLAARGAGAWIEQRGRRRPLRLVPGVPTAPLRMVGSRSHPDPLVVSMQQALGITDIRPSGSVGVKCGLIAAGECDLYVHPVPYLREWDTCAPEVVLREAGGAVTDCLGEPLRYNKPEPTQPHGILAAHADLQARVLAAVEPLYRQAAVAR